MIELNKVLLMARLTRDPELKYLPSGMAVCTLRVASDRSFAGKSGDRQKETLFIDVTAWGKTAEFCNEWMKKGSAVFVEGRLKMDTWKDKETGKDREKIQIVAEQVRFGETKAEAQARGQRTGGNEGSSGGPSYGDSPSDEPQGGGTNDDLPF